MKAKHIIFPFLFIYFNVILLAMSSFGFFNFRPVMVAHQTSRFFSMNIAKRDNAGISIAFKDAGRESHRVFQQLPRSSLTIHHKAEKNPALGTSSSKIPSRLVCMEGELICGDFLLPQVSMNMKLRYADNGIEYHCIRFCLLLKNPSGCFFRTKH